MRRRLFIIALAIAVVCIGFGLFGFRKSPSPGNFPADFSEAERRDVMSVCRRDAITETIREIKLGKIRLALHCLPFAALGKVQDVRIQPSGIIHVTFSAPATKDFAGGAKYSMKKMNGHWVIVGSF